MARQTIPIARPSLTNRERNYLLKAFDSGYISASGDYVTKFEEAFCEYFSVDYAVSCSSGTSALHLSLASLEIGRDCEVILPGLTFVATKNAVLYQKAVPVVVDVDPSTYCIDVDKITEMISSRTKAIIAVHLYGNPCDMKRLMEICASRKIHLIEDCAESFESTYGGELCGNLSTVSCFSFYGNKTLTTGQGGMIATNSKELADRARHLKNQAMVYPYKHSELGYNYRMTNLEAAIGLAQLERAEEIVEMKDNITAYYRKNLHYRFQTTTSGSEPVFWMNTIECADKDERIALNNHLFTLGIETRPCFEPMGLYNSVSDRLSQTVLCLPSGPVMSKQELERVVEAVNGYKRAH